jgi:hypothetical protein
LDELNERVAITLTFAVGRTCLLYDFYLLTCEDPSEGRRDGQNSNSDLSTLFQIFFHPFLK